MRDYELTNQNKITITTNPAKVSIERPDEQLWLTQADISDLFKTTKIELRSIIVKLLNLQLIDKQKHTRRIHFTTDNQGPTKASFDTQYSIFAITLIATQLTTEPALAYQKWNSQMTTNYLTKGFSINKPYLKESTKSAQNLYRQLKNAVPIFQQ
ncbi:hypothetical protein DID75_04705 [Candidatus Marinamargulisbacteria bacterium SCGC AG-410-N11]|nr:hypothetical protein DID75_04705 [Candidatus Marinamargulisbacteria bacterium SCGC AG-410-N11]